MNSKNITTRRHQVCHRLRPLFGEGKSPPVTSVSVAQLAAMLDCPHEDGSAWAVASKSTKAGMNVTTAVDVPLGSGVQGGAWDGHGQLLEGVAKRRPAVQLVRAEGTKASNGWNPRRLLSGASPSPHDRPNSIASTAPGLTGGKS
jgi:hypothetical protein